MGKKNKRPQMVAVELESELPELVAPEFTICADSKFGIHCMIAIASHVEMLDPEERPVVLAKLREFELYEEAFRA